MNVYFIQAGDKGPIKIGVARSVERRLEALQTGNHEELRIITKIMCEGLAHAYATERKFHKMFKKYRIRGEWFKPKILNSNCLDTDMGIIEDRKKFGDRELDLSQLSIMREAGLI